MKKNSLRYKGKKKKEENETHKFKAKAATRTLFILHKKECCRRGFALI
jgi:hypothetical protein